MAEADGTIRIATSIDIKNLQSQLDQMKSDIKKTSEDSKKDLSQIAAQFAAVAASAALLVKAVKSVGDAFGNYAEATDRVDKMSQSLGLTRETFQELDYAFKQNGASLDNFGMGMKSLQELTAKAATGATTAFDKLGVSIKDSSGNIKSQDEILKETLSAFNKMEQGVDKSTLATDVFGRSAQELMPVLNQTAGSIDELRGRAHDLGVVMSDETVNAGVELGDTVSDLKSAISGLVNGAIAPFSKSLTNAVNEITSFIKWLNGGSASASALKAVIVTVTVAVLGLVAAFIVIPAAVSAITAAVNILTAAVAANPIGAILVGVTALTAGIAVLVTGMSDGTKSAKQLSSATDKLKQSESEYKSIQDQLNSTMSTATQMEKDLLNARKDLLAQDIKQQALDIAKSYDKNSKSIKKYTDLVNQINKAYAMSKKQFEDGDISQRQWTSLQKSYEQQLVKAQTNLDEATAAQKGAILAVSQGVSDGVISIGWMRDANFELYDVIMRQARAMKTQSKAIEDTGDKLHDAGGELAEWQKQLQSVLNSKDVSSRTNAIAEYMDTTNEQLKRSVEAAQLTGGDVAKVYTDYASKVNDAVTQLIESGVIPANGDLAKKMAQFAQSISNSAPKVPKLDAYLEETQKVGNAVQSLSKQVDDGYISQDDANKQLLATIGQTIDAMYMLGYAANASGSDGDKALADLISKYKELSAVVNATDNQTKEIDLWQMFKDNLKKNAASMKSSVVNAFAPVIVGLKSSKIYRKCAEVGSAVSEKIGDGISKAKDYVVKALFGVTRDAATDSAIKTALKNAGKNLASSLVSGFTAVKDFLSKTWSAIDWMANFDLSSAQSAVTKFVSGLGDFFINDLQNLPAFFDAAVDAVDNMVSGLVSALPTIKKNIGIIIQKIVSYLKGDGFKELLKLVIYLIVSIAEAILENLGDIVDAVLEVIPEIIIALADALPEIVSAIVSAIPKIVVAVVKAIPAIIYALGVAFVDLCKAIFSLAVGAGDYIWKGIVAGFKAAGNWLYTYIISPIEGAFSAMCDWIGGIFGKIGDAIGSILKAPINGIIAAINWIIDQINNIRIDNDWLNIHVGFSLGHLDYLAKGTDDWKGGEAIVGEKGPELVDLPAGSVVHPATETASLLSGMSALRSGFMPSLAFASSGSGNSSMSVNVSPTTVQIDGRTVGRIVYEQIDKLAANS